MSAPRVGIYNRWLATLGGGEKHSLAIAEWLSRTCDVEVISHQPVPGSIAAGRFNLDLSRVVFKSIPDRSPLDITPLTAAYDLFINASHQEYFPSLARHSVQMVFFPARLDRQKIWSRRLKFSLRRWLKLPSVMAGSPAFSHTNGEFAWDIDTQLKIRLPASLRPYRLRFVLRPLDHRVKRATVLLDGAGVDSIVFPQPLRPVGCDVEIPGVRGDVRQELSLLVESELEPGEYPAAQLAQLWLDLPQYRFYHALFERGLRAAALRLQYFPPGSAMLEYLDSYAALWANSEFTRRWISAYWQRDSAVLYPPVAAQDFYCAPKENIILSVGRFFAGQHNKKHLSMIQSFKRLADAGLQGWELHLAGGRMQGAEHERYLAGLKQAARGYPVAFHEDISFERLVALYARSAIYWHASGYGENYRRHPEMQEHFGVTTVEAMASGCVPVVIDRGGQPEIVLHGRNGYVWRSQKQLAGFTLQLVNDPLLRDKLACQAVVDSRRYDMHHFHSRLRELLQLTGLF